MTIFITIGTMFLAAGINRLRGMGISGSRLYASVLMGLLAGVLFWDFRPGVTTALCYLFWSAFSWGRWFDLERMPDNWNRDPNDISTFDKAIESVSFGSDHVAMIVRHMFGILPAGLLLGYTCGWEWLAVIPIFGVAVMACYEMAWRIDKEKAIEIAELLTGLVWGSLLLSIFFMCSHSWPTILNARLA